MAGDKEINIFHEEMEKRLMRKILIVITTGFVPYGGLTTVMMNYYRVMDKTGLQIDFASTNEPPQELLDELRENGSNYYCLGDRKKCLPRYLKHLKKLLKAESYDVLHVNGNSATMVLELAVAKKCNMPIRIAHGHTTKTSHYIINKMLKKSFNKAYTNAVAVSKKAGDWLYGDENYTVLKNAIDLDKYKFNEETRAKYRAKWGLEENFVIGHVGKLYEPKNHTFLIETFKELKCIRKDVKLLLVGDGNLADVLKKECEELKIEEDVIFTGMRNDSNNFLQAMDIFVFPSLWEGSPVALIEAQTSGLTCLVSTNVTTEVSCIEELFYKDLKDGPKDWAEKINSLLQIKTMRNEAVQQVKRAGFDISFEANKLKTIYLS